MESTFDIVEERPDFPGYLYRPKEKGTYPGILLLHGSDGGNGDFWYEPDQRPIRTGDCAILPSIARYYAIKGYVAYALCYFDCDHHIGFDEYPPQDLRNIDLYNITYRALKWLRESSFVAGKKVAIWGASRGAEQALLLSSLLAQHNQIYKKRYLEPDVVMALSPSEEVIGAFSLQAAQAIMEGKEPVWGNDPSWVFHDPITIGEKIDLSMCSQPFFLSYFEQDPVWNVQKTPSSLRDGYANQKDLDLFVSKQCVLQQEQDKIKSLSFRSIYLELQGSGHVLPPLGTTQNSLLKWAIDYFLDVHLS